MGFFSNIFSNTPSLPSGSSGSAFGKINDAENKIAEARGKVSSLNLVTLLHQKATDELKLAADLAHGALNKLHDALDEVHDLLG